MKTVTKALVAAVGLAIGAQAQAAINTDGAINPDGSGTGAGELFLSVIDRSATAPKSYTLDLGVSAAQFKANDASYLNTLSFSADPNLATFIATATGNISWNIAAASNTITPTFDDYGFFTTSPTAPIANLNTVQGFAGLGGPLTKLASYATEINQTLVPNQNDFAADTSVVITSTASNAYHDGFFWGDAWTTASMSTEGALGDSLGFYFIGLDFTNDPSTNSSYVQEMLGEWTLASNGTLSYTSDVGAPVPVPAAVWLLGSALVGLVGVARRKSEEA